MKPCPFCAEQIQDAAVKCRYCGSMVGPWPAGSTPSDAEAFGEPPVPPVPPPAPLPGIGSSRTSMVALVVIGLLMAVIGVLLVKRGRDATADAGPAAPSPSEAATISPAKPTDAVYQFLGIGWGTSRADVRAQLEARGFAFIETDGDGDDQFQGRVDGRDAGVAAMYAASGLTKFVVVMLAADPEGGLLQMYRQQMARAYGPPSRQRDVATIWPERAGTLVWVTSSEDRHVTVHFEAAGWPAESRRRKGAAGS